MNAVVRSRKDSGNLFNEVNRLQMGNQGKKKLKFHIINGDLVLSWLVRLRNRLAGTGAGPLGLGEDHHPVRSASAFTGIAYTGHGQLIP